jgi:PPOX class probable F420-dependent enzyme
MLDLARPHHAHIDRRLRTEPIIWFGSTRPDGGPHLVPVWFLWDGVRVLVFSLPNTQKVINLRNNPSVTLALDAADQGYDIVRLDGRATLSDDPDIRGTMPAFVEKYVGIPRRWSAEEWAAKFSQAIEVRPTKLVSWMTRPGSPPVRTTIRF